MELWDLVNNEDHNIAQNLSDDCHDDATNGASFIDNGENLDDRDDNDAHNEDDEDDDDDKGFCRFRHCPQTNCYANVVATISV